MNAPTQPEDARRHRDDLKCVCGHYESQHDLDPDPIPIHDCPDCECKGERGWCLVCRESPGTLVDPPTAACIGFRSVALAGGALTPRHEWDLYLAALGLPPVPPNGGPPPAQDVNAGGPP